MNITNESCHKIAFDVKYLTYWQLATLTVVNLSLLPTNLIANASVLYILIKTKQLSNVSCKIIFMLSLSDLLIALFVQSLFLVLIYDGACSVKIASIFISTFLAHLSAYTIAVIGVDRFIRIKYKVSFRTVLTPKLLTVLTFIMWLAAVIHAVMITIGTSMDKEQEVRTIGLIVDGFVLGIIIILQMITICKSNSIVVDLQSRNIFQQTSERITKLCTKIMLMTTLLITPILIANFTRNRIYHGLNVQEKSIMEFVQRLCMLILYGNSLANAVLFLTTNGKAKRYLKALFYDNNESVNHQPKDLIKEGLSVDNRSNKIVSQ